MTDSFTVGNPQFLKLQVRMEVKLDHPQARLPSRSRDTDAGYDIYSIEEVIVHSKCTAIVHTGIRLSAPPGYYYTIEGRSSLGFQNIVPNRGIIDSTYCGEVLVRLVNFTDRPYKVEPGHRIAQIILHRQYDADFVEVQEFSPEYNQRGENGFGSTGK
jgi:dUTP pyrophosphatase